MRPQLISCYFSGEDANALETSDRYDRMAAVLRHTAQRHCPLWDVRVDRITPHAVPRRSGANPSHVQNTQKLEYWTDTVLQAPEGSLLLLIDADTFITRSLDAIWERPFDIAYTVRPSESRLPFNGGVIAVRANDRSRAFFTAFRQVNRTMLADPVTHAGFRKRFGGINQAAFGALLETPSVQGGAVVEQLRCHEWNCEETGWAEFDPAVTRIVHVKSSLRRAIFSMTTVPDGTQLRTLVAMWRRLEKEATKPC